jgi:hypothetical protein
VRRFEINLGLFYRHEEKTSTSFETIERVIAHHRSYIGNKYKNLVVPELSKKETDDLLRSQDLTAQGEYEKIDSLFMDVFIAEMKRQGGYL